MLVLTRRVGQIITIGDEVAVEVLEVKGKQVRLGIAAPRELPIHRKEVYECIQLASIESTSKNDKGERRE